MSGGPSDRLTAMARKDPPRLTDPYGSGSEPPPPNRSSLPSVPDLPPPRGPSLAGPPPRGPAPPDAGPPAATRGPLQDPNQPPGRPDDAEARASLSVLRPEQPAALRASQIDGRELATVGFPLGEAPPTPRRRRLGLALGAIGGVLAVLALAVGGLIWYRARPTPVTPFPLKSLPESTVLVGRDAGGVFMLGLAAAELPPEADWSRLSAELCGGTDVFGLLMRPTRRYARLGLADAMENRRQISDALGCGRTLAKARKGQAAYYYSVKLPTKDEEKPTKAPKRDERHERGEPELPVLRLARVHLFHVDLTTPPDTTRLFREHRDRAGLAGTRCLVRDRDGGRAESECTDFSRASAHLEGTSMWVGGTLQGITAFGKDFSPKATNKLADEDVWNDLTARFERYAIAEIGTHEVFDPLFLFHTGFGWTSQDQALTEAYDKLQRLVVKYEAWWAVGDRVGPDGGDLRLDLVAKGDSEAIDLLLDVKEWHAALKDLVDKHAEAPESKEDEDLKRAERDYYKMLHASAAKAIKDALIEREGKRVTLTVDVKYDEEDRRKMAATRELALERAALAAKIVAALAQGDKPDEDVLRQLGGRDLIEAVKDPDKTRRELSKE